MFSPIDLHLKPSLASLLIIALPAAAAFLLIHQSSAPGIWLGVLSAVVSLATLWLILDEALRIFPHSIVRLHINDDKAQAWCRNGTTSSAHIHSDSIQLGNFCILVLQSNENRRRCVMLHRNAVSHVDHMRRLRVLFRFNKLPHSSSSTEVHP
ncbi:MAG: protein YgfX [Oleiphilaceae bacterium]|nr:protein YgfX [Oleiphilaceae bacterium]